MFIYSWQYIGQYVAMIVRVIMLIFDYDFLNINTKIISVIYRLFSFENRRWVSKRRSITERKMFSKINIFMKSANYHSIWEKNIIFWCFSSIFWENGKYRYWFFSALSYRVYVCYCIQRFCFPVLNDLMWYVFQFFLSNFWISWSGSFYLNIRLNTIENWNVNCANPSRMHTYTD